MGAVKQAMLDEIDRIRTPTKEGHFVCFSCEEEFEEIEGNNPAGASEECRDCWRERLGI